MRFFHFVLTIFLFFLGHSSLYGFTLNITTNASFEQDEVLINVRSGTDCSNAGVSDSELLDLAVESVNKFWNQVSTSRLRLQRGSLVSASANFDTQNLCTSTNPCIPNTNLLVSNDILIACNDNTGVFPAGSGTIASTLANNVEGERIFGSVILINNQAALATNPFNNLSRDNKIAVLAHEIGHAFGLGHSGDTAALMYFSISDATNRKKLGQDDWDGVTYLYPKETVIFNFLGCASLSYNDTDKKGDFFKGEDQKNTQMKDEALRSLSLLRESLSDPLFNFYYLLTIVVGIILPGIFIRGLKSLKSLSQ